MIGGRVALAAEPALEAEAEAEADHQDSIA